MLTAGYNTIIIIGVMYITSATGRRIDGRGFSTTDGATSSIHHTVTGARTVSIRRTTAYTDSSVTHGTTSRIQYTYIGIYGELCCGHITGIRCLLATMTIRIG